MRAVKVEAFSPCSAVQIQYVSIAFTCLGSASPRQLEQELLGCGLALGDHRRRGSASVVPSAMRAERATIAHHLRGQPGEIVARLLVGDLAQLAELPERRQPRRLRLEVGGRVAGQPDGLVRLRLGITESRSLSTSRPHTRS